MRVDGPRPLRPHPGALRVGGTEVNAWLVEQGFAVAYRRYSDAYAAHEARARTARRGLWAGTFEEPEAWRIAHARR